MQSSIRLILVFTVCFMGVACNRAVLRIPGASLDFPKTATGFVAARTVSATIEVALPVDVRSTHYDDTIAGTRWEGCRTDTFWRETASDILQQRVKDELVASKLFRRVGADLAPGDHFVLKAEIHAFCSQVVGFIFERVAGIVAVKSSLMKNGDNVWEQQIEHVVTDADPDYTGSQVTFIEQAMRVAMSDSLRLTLRDLLTGIERSQIGASGSNIHAQNASGIGG